MAEQETYYEMLWDCPQCGTLGLLGDSHRHCPTCGTAQDPTKRYFPTPGEEVEAKSPWLWWQTRQPRCQSL